MKLSLVTPLKGTLLLSDEVSHYTELLQENNLYKFIWVRTGELSLTVDHIPIQLLAGEVLPLSPLQRLEIKSGVGESLLLAFDSNFYCIFGHDGEVSCNGLLFTGQVEPLRLRLSEERGAALAQVVDELKVEYDVDDGLREEMLRMQLKRFIIICTRIAREHFAVDAPREQVFDIVRQFFVLVDQHFRTRKRVQDYAEMLHRSPKTLTNLFATYGHPTPLSVIHDRVNAEARRLLLYTNKSAKEVAYMVGYEDAAAFSRFFAKMNNLSITEFRRANRE